MRSRGQVRQGLMVTLCLVASAVAASRAARGAAPGSGPGAGTGAAANIILPADIRAAAPSSPARALLTWVAAVQVRDLGRVHQLTAGTTRPRVSGGALDRAVLTIGATFARPVVLDSRIRGNVASLNVLLVSYAAGTTRPVQSVPATLRLRRYAAGWRVLDVGPLFPNLARARRPRGSAARDSGAR